MNKRNRRLPPINSTPTRRNNTVTNPPQSWAFDEDEILTAVESENIDFNFSPKEDYFLVAYIVNKGQTGEKRTKSSFTKRGKQFNQLWIYYSISSKNILKRRITMGKEIMKNLKKQSLENIGLFQPQESTY